MNSQYDLQTQLYYTVRAFNQITGSSLNNPHTCSVDDDDEYLDFLTSNLAKRMKDQSPKIQTVANLLGCYDAADLLTQTSKH